MENNREKDTFYRQIWKLVLPILIQNLLSAAVNSSDVVMLNYVGQAAICFVPNITVSVTCVQWK